ncbi:MAG: ROK family protein [Bacteroidales bacterium]|jgi:glucokinase|nr:ROK family protein [Bacteroidales bacterium]
MKYSIGIDIGGTNTVFGLVDCNGNIVKRTNIKTADYKIKEDFFESLFDGIKSLFAYAQSKEDILAVGIGAPNGNIHNGTIDNAPNLAFKGIVQLKKELEQRLISQGYNQKVFVTNDANAAAMGEMIYGKARNGVTDFIMITLGTGVGSGIVVNGQVVYGFSGMAGEIGHTFVKEGGRKCKCGRSGCLEQYASSQGILLTAKELMESYQLPSLLKQVPFEELTVEKIANAAKAGDNLALMCFERAAEALSFALANAIAVTSPRKVYFFGGIAQSGDILLEPLRRKLEDKLYISFRNTVEIEMSGLQGADAAILGAAALGIAHNPG